MPLVQAGVAGLRAVDINDLALNTTLYYAADLSYTALNIGLSSAIFGVLTLLVVVALTFLIRKGFSHTPVKVLVPSTLLLYASTTLFMASLAGHVASINRLVAQAQAGLFSDAYTDADREEFEGSVLRHSWTITAALGANILIGDSIVWWRVCAVWRTRVVYCLGPLLIVLILAFGTSALCGTQECLDPPQQPQTLFRDGFFADASTVLSLAVNVLSVMLIGYKAWAHRRLLRMHLGSGRRTSRVLKALALLVESGTIYCLLLIVVFVYQASSASIPMPGTHQDAFFDALADYSYSCFIPVIAIYPVLIIVIVALNWSPIGHGDLSDGTQLGRPRASSGGARRPPAHPGLNRVTTMSAVVFADTAQTLSSRNDGSGDGASEVETKRDTTVV